MFRIADLVVNNHVQGRDKSGKYITSGVRYVYMIRGSEFDQWENMLKIKMTPLNPELHSFFMDLDTLITNIKNGRFTHYPVKKGKKKCLAQYTLK